MPAIQKRTGYAKIAQELPEAKKAKKAAIDVVENPKIAAITTALEDESFVVAGPESNREMLIQMAPVIFATPKDQRHAHMEAMAQNFKEVFANEEARLQGKVAETEAKINEASNELESRKAAAEVTSSDLQVKANVIIALEDALADSEKATAEADSTLKEVTWELNFAKEMKSDLSAEQEGAKSMMESFTKFKDGCDESLDAEEQQNQLKTLGAFCKKIKADVSLVAALPMALGRKPAQRSDFDAMVVDQLEQKLEGKLTEIAEKVESNETEIVEKTDFKATSETRFGEATEKQIKWAEAVEEVKAEQDKIHDTLVTKREAVIKQEFAVKAVEAELSEKIAFLKAHQDLQNTLTELIELVTPVEPEVVTADTAEAAPVAEVVMADAMEAVPEPVAVTA